MIDNSRDGPRVGGGTGCAAMLICAPETCKDTGSEGRHRQRRPDKESTEGR